VIEVLVAAVIFVILAASITTVFLGANRSWIQTEARLQIYQNAQEALDRMSKELTTVFPSTTVGPLDDSSNHIPLKLDDSTYDGGSYDDDQLTFVAAYNVSPDSGEYDLTHLGYRLDTTDTNNPKLQRYKKDFSASYNGSTLDSGCWKEMAEYIISLNFRCYDGANWQDNWSSATLPKAVEITVMLQDKQRKYNPQTFQNIIHLPAQ